MKLRKRYALVPLLALIGILLGIFLLRRSTTPADTAPLPPAATP